MPPPYNHCKCYDLNKYWMKTLREYINLIELNNLVESLLFELGFSPDSFLSKVQSVATLALRGATEGERSASLQALQRLQDRAAEAAKTLSKADADRFLMRVQNIVKSATNPSASSSTPPPRNDPPRDTAPQTPKFKVGNWIYSINDKKAGKITRIVSTGPVIIYGVSIDGKDVLCKQGFLRAATQDEVDAAGADKSSDSAKSFKEGDYVIIVNGNHQGKLAKVLGPYSGTTMYIVWFSNIGEQGLYKVENLRKATADEIKSGGAKAGSSKSNSNVDEWRIVKLAHFKEGTSDKLYGVATKGREVRTFWGRRTGSFQTKVFPSVLAASTIFNDKLAKGYQQVDNQSWLDFALATLKRSL